MINPKEIKKDFPIFSHFRDKPLVYLDSTATALKPRQVIEALNDYYRKYSANVFRGVYKLSQKATDKYEEARKKVAAFIGAKEKEIVFVRNTTEALNIVAFGYVKQLLQRNDTLVTTILEHHSNFVPWQYLAKEKQAKLHVIDINSDGLLQYKSAASINALKIAKVVTFTHISNVLGTINPVKEMVEFIRNLNPKSIIIIDGAQAVPHLPVDVQKLGCDFYAFSGHKMLGPTGIGVLWGRKELLNNTLPQILGGEMIQKVTVTQTTYKESPHKFEGGTPHIAGSIGLGAAVDYLTQLGMENVRKHEEKLLGLALKSLAKLPYVKVYGPKNLEVKTGVVTFTIDGIYPHDIAEILDRDNVCIRTGHHCTMPLHSRLKLPSSARASFYVYNTEGDIEMLISALKKTHKVFN